MYPSQFCSLGSNESIHVEKSRGSSFVSRITARYQIRKHLKTKRSNRSDYKIDKKDKSKKKEMMEEIEQKMTRDTAHTLKHK